MMAYKSRKTKLEKPKILNIKYRETRKDQACGCCHDLIPKGGFGWKNGRDWYHDSCPYLEQIGMME